MFEPSVLEEPRRGTNITKPSTMKSVQDPGTLEKILIYLHIHKHNMLNLHNIFFTNTLKLIKGMY